MRKDVPKCPKGLLGQCLCASLSPASKEHNLVIAILHAFVCVCVYFAAEVSSAGPKQSWVLLIQSKK